MAAKHPRDETDPTRWESARAWLRRHLRAAVAFALTAVVVPVAIAIATRTTPPPAPVQATIEMPRPGPPGAPALLDAGAVVEGTVSGEDGEVHLAVRDGRRVVPVGAAIPPEAGHWVQRLPGGLRRGVPLTLLVGVHDDGRIGRVLDQVPFFVRVPAPAHPLFAIAPQAAGSGGTAFDFASRGGRMNAAFDDGSACHRPDRAHGVRLEWNPAAAGYAGWGVGWRQSPAGSFDASRFDRLVLTVKGARGGEPFQVALRDAAGRDSTRLESEAVGFVPARTEWRTLNVRLARLGGVDLRALENVSLGFNASHGHGEMCIDELRLAGAAPAGYTPPAAGEPVRPQVVRAEAERATAAARTRSRSAASGQATLRARTAAGARYRVALRYSNDNNGPLETVTVTVDGRSAGSFAAQDTGGGGAGWNVFRTSGPLATLRLARGEHRVGMAVRGGDGYGVELDRVTLVPVTAR